ncbi:MAG: PKD domain-containing protein [Bacteroidota bacterium]|nr:PKD domain-containing protein [Bacteroidota bacterium]
MKPTKTILSITGMLALFISVVVIAGCKKDASVDNTASGTVSADRYYYNKVPVARAGADQTIALPVDSAKFDGSSSTDPDGTISSYAWTKDIGAGGTITSPHTARTSVTGLSAGNYRFKLTVTDNRGAIASDTVHVTVTGTGGPTSPANQPPVVNAGPAQTVIAPASSATLSGSATDADGTIASYLWTKVSGTGGTITSPNSATTTVTGLSAGSYVFNLKATDNGGASGNQAVTVTVSAGTPPPNQPPVVTVGAAQTITLPVSSVTLTGTATDADGTIASYLWTKTSGGVAVIATPNAASTLVSGLVAGSYMFNLQVTDNGGASTNKTVAVTVNAATTGSGGTSGYNTLLYSNGYDNAASLNTNQLGNGSISTTVFKSGTGSFKSLVTAGEGQISSGWRSEQQYPETYSQTGDEIAIEYDELFESLPNVGGLSVQWHGNVQGTSGETSLWISGGQFMVQRSICGGAGCGNIYQTGNLMTIQTNRWYHMRWEIKFSAGSDGYERLYIDGNLYYSATGQTSDGGGQYLKVGQNLFASPGNNSVMYLDNLNVWKK